MQFQHLLQALPAVAELLFQDLNCSLVPGSLLRFVIMPSAVLVPEVSDKSLSLLSHTLGFSIKAYAKPFVLQRLHCLCHVHGSNTVFYTVEQIPTDDGSDVMDVLTSTYQVGK